MSLIKLKNSVACPRSLIIAMAAVNAANVIGLKQDLLITSANDSTHMRGSKHYTDDALDFRTKHLPAKDKQAWLIELKRRLGRSFDVVLESEDGANEHAHVEYDPKKP